MPELCHCGSRTPHWHCTTCGTIIRNTSTAVVYDGGIHHRGCFADRHTDEEGPTCRECGEEVSIDDATSVVYRDDYTSSLLHDGCVDHTIFGHCGTCGLTVETDYQCPMCNGMGVVNHNIIHDYHYTPPTLFFKGSQSSEELFLGIELEIDRVSDTYGPMDNCTSSHRAGLELIPGWCYAKYDSSLRAGFEIVTQPMSVNWLNQNIHTLVEKFAQWRALGYGSAEPGTCGMHVHMSKIAFTHVHLYKFMYLVYAHPALSLLLSQRTQHSFEQWACPFTDKSDIHYRAKHKIQGNRNRHDAVNVSTKPTVELRIFAGTLNPLTFHKNLDTTLAMFRFSQDASVQHINVRTFTDYVYDNKFLYPYLSLFLSDKGGRQALFMNDTPVLTEEQTKQLSQRGMI